MSQNTLKPQPINNIEKVQTDKNWIYIFGGVMGFLLALTIYALVRGRPELLSRPYDPDNQPCGVGSLEDYPFIYFVNPTKKYIDRTVCVKECPQMETVPPNASLDCAKNSLVKQCKLNIGKKTGMEDYLLIYDSYAYINKVCLPANAKYFEIVREALKIGKLDLIFSDILSSLPLILCFGVLCSLLSYYTKYFMDNDQMSRITYFIVFFLSALGCFILGAVLFNKFVSIIFDSPQSKKEVISSSSDAYSFTSAQNSSSVFYLLASLVCFWQFAVFIKDQISSDTMKNHEIRIKMLNNIPEIINNRKYLEFVPIIAFFVTVIILILFYYIERNVFSIVTVDLDRRLTPFDHLRRTKEPLILNIFLVPILIWLISTVIQACEYITLQSTYMTLDRQQDVTLLQLFKDMLHFRMGTIFKGAFLIGFTDWIRTPLEMLEYNYQDFVKKNKNKDQEPNFLRKAQRFVCNAYQNSQLKSYTKYAYIDNARGNKEFVESGLFFQSEIMDKNRWIENLVDMSEVFENQLNISICMIITISFYYTLKLIFSNASISSFTTTAIFVLGFSFLISLFQVNLYGTTYCCIILQYTIQQNEKSPTQLSQAKFISYLKEEFSNRIDTKLIDGENAPAYIKFCNKQ